ncbi:hypothetical protein EC957_011140 [Mortierella hygrophila]|uniref:RRM domain-containing protein n=1 Tax=Mortierella hygrophila TaxID=979708 RepID=A0A9P6F921_9FUNG|nr:hypothetical protein EC957_011140 [Mortierella hygrophila]
MDSQHQQQHAWPVQPHAGAYIMGAPQMAAAQHQQPQGYPQQYQQQQHSGMMDHQQQQQQHPMGGHHIPAPHGVPAHHQGYGVPPQEPPRGGPNPGARRSPPPYRPAYRERSYSPPPRHRRTPSPRGYRDSRGGYERDMGGYQGGRYDRGYDRGGYDRSDRGGYDRGYDRGGYDRGYDRSYDRGYGGGQRGGYDRGGYGRPRSPPRRRTINRGSEEDRLNSRTLYIGNIPYSFREPEVEEMFKKFGTIVKITVVLDQFTGRNKGFAFVEYEDRKNAEEAMEKYNGFDVEGRRLKLDWDIGLGKKDIKPPRSTGTTENSTAETTPQPQTHSTTEASTPAESAAQKSDESSPVLPVTAVENDSAADAATTEVATDMSATHLTEAQQPAPSTEEPSIDAAITTTAITTTAPEQHEDGSAEAPVEL